MSSVVEITIRLERPVVPSGRTSDIDIAIEVACEAPNQAPARDQIVNLCMAIDCSGSMIGAKIATAIECATRLTTQLSPADQLTIVSFASAAEVVYNPDLSRDLAVGRIRQLKTGGRTDLSAGFRLSLLELQTHGRPEYLNRVVLMTDGQANEGETKSSVLAADARRASEMGISTTCIGIGDDFSYEILYAMAGTSGGNFYSVQQDQLDRIVEHESARALATYMVNAILQLELPPGVTLSARSNMLKELEPQHYRLPPIEIGTRTRYGYRLRVDPALARGDGFPIRARLTMQGRDVNTGTATLRVGTEQEYVDALTDDAVLLTREQFWLAEQEHQMAEIVSAGDMGAVRVRMDKLRDAMSVARSDMAIGRHADAMDAEIVDLGALRDVINALSGLQGASNDAALQRWMEVEAKPRLEKLLLHRASKHGHRGMGAGIDDEALQHAVDSLRRSLISQLEGALHRKPANPLLLGVLRRLEA